MGVIFDKIITRRMHIETIVVKAYGTFIRICHLLKRD